MFLYLISRINEKTLNSSHSKYQSLIQLIQKMTNEIQNVRPNCDVILRDKNLWAINLEELEKDSKVNEMNFDWGSNGNSFAHHFYKIKVESH